MFKRVKTNCTYIGVLLNNFNVLVAYTSMFCNMKEVCLRWLNTVLAVCEPDVIYRQEKDSRSQAETWQVKNIMMKDID